MKKSYLACSTLVLASLALGCQRESAIVTFDDDAEVSAPETTRSGSLPELSVDEILASKPSAPQAPVAAQAPQTSPVAAESKPVEVKSEPVVVNPPKFDAKGVSVDLSESVGFSGAVSSDLTKWQGVKVVRGKGVLTQGALETFAKLPQLTEFLWSDAVLDSTSSQAFADLAKAPKLKKVRLTGVKLSDANAFPVFVLEALSKSSALVDLDVSGSPLTAADLAKVDLKSGFASLVKINLYQTKVGDEGVAVLAPLADRLTSLNLDDAGISPQSADGIAKFSNLTFLHVGRSTLDDESVAKFAQLAKLEKIHITRSAATEEGADRLRKALPNCVVVSQPEN